MESAQNSQNGRFIVVDGPDGSGKSTQVALLGDYLRGRGLRVLSLRDPGGTPIGDRIRSILLDAAHDEMSPVTETLLFMASRAQLVHELIAPALAGGEVVLCDRYVSSTLAYQCAAGMNEADVMALAKVAVAGCWPDLTVVLDLPVEAAFARLNRQLDRLESKDVDFHRRVRESFLRQARDEPQRFAVVDAQGEVDHVQGRLRQAVDQALAARRPGRGGP